MYYLKIGEKEELSINYGTKIIKIYIMRTMSKEKTNTNQAKKKKMQNLIKNYFNMNSTEINKNYENQKENLRSPESSKNIDQLPILTI